MQNTTKNNEENYSKNQFENIDLEIPKYNAEELTSEEFEDILNKYKRILSEVNLWEKIGFSRPLGGLFYNFVLSIIGILIGLVFIGFLLSVLYPWP